jgi:PAS domain S-box-containing protein
LTQGHADHANIWQADNPIVFASDGFVSVTGFPRNEIIPRNCRFLQGRNTHQTSVKRLRKKIERHEETVELLLNYKKNGEPFWNLLYMTPLFDSNGKLIFFLGGQINCSTTVHTSSDVLRILAQSKDSGEEETLRLETPQAAKPPRARRMLSVFRTNSSSNIKQQSPGMENKLLNKIEDMPLKSQMDTFYTAYSNVSQPLRIHDQRSASLTTPQYLVVNYSTFLITFISTGLLDLLFPIKAARSSTFAPPNSQITPAAMAVGTDVFRFLANHGTGSSSRFSSGDVSWDFKSTIKSALKLGNPVSVEMRLCARPLMGFERFVLHWTPLKDEKGAVHWVVLTLGNEQRA